LLGPAAVLDRERRLIREGLEQLEIGFREASSDPAQDNEYTDPPIADLDRDA
jgi:hypothetical protein